MSTRRSDSKITAARLPILRAGDTLVLDAHVLNDDLQIEALTTDERPAAAIAETHWRAGARWNLVNAIIGACPRIASNQDLTKQVPIAASGKRLADQSRPVPVGILMAALNRLKARKHGIFHIPSRTAPDLNVEPPFPREDEFFAKLAWATSAKIIVSEDRAHDAKLGVPEGPVLLAWHREERVVVVVDVGDALEIVGRILGP